MRGSVHGQNRASESGDGAACTRRGRSLCWSATLCFAVLAINHTPCPAQTQPYDHADISAFESPEGQLSTGLIFWATANAQNGELEEARVFSGQFDDDDDYVVNNPGWGTPPGLLPGASFLFWDFLPMTLDVDGSPLTSTLLYWDAAGAVDFGAAPSGHELWLAGGSGFAIADGGDEMVPGGAIAQSANSGYVHEHHDFFLDDSDGNSQTTPDDGIYLVAMQLRMTGLETSKPFYMVWATPGVELLPAIDAAMAWVEPRVDTLVPIPLTGDFNGDGFVDTADYTTWRDGFATGDFTIDDYQDWKANFGAPAAAVSGTPSVTSIPEPTGLGLLAMSFLATLAGLPRQRAGR